MPLSARRVRHFARVAAEWIMQLQLPLLYARRLGTLRSLRARAAP